MLLGTLGFVNLWIAVLADVGTSIVVTLNGLRLARLERDREPRTVDERERDHGEDHEAIAAD